jgi:hypothetical protein
MTALAPDPGPILPGDPPPGPRALVPPGAALAVGLMLGACVQAGPEERRAAYLDCARAQGLEVEAGTIVTRSAQELSRLDACRALPR